MDERRLAQRAREGDLAAYETLLRRYQPLAMHTAYAVLWDRHDAEEAVQEAFVKAWRNLGSFKPGAAGARSLPSARPRRPIQPVTKPHPSTRSSCPRRSPA